MADTVEATDTFNLFPAAATSHVLNFSRMPQVSFVLQEVILPGISSAAVKTNNAGMTVRHAPDKVVWDPLTVQFLVDEEFRAHRELYHWINGVAGSYDRSKLTSEFIDDQKKYMYPEMSLQKTHGRMASTHAGLTIVNGAKIPVLRVLFFNVFITTLGEVRFATTTPDTNVPLTASATFEYDYYTIATLNR